jgi:hypothetical protein
MYGNCKKMGLFLGTVNAIALVTSVIVNFTRPTVSEITYDIHVVTPF